MHKVSSNVKDGLEIHLKFVKMYLSMTPFAMAHVTYILIQNVDLYQSFNTGAFPGNVGVSFIGGLWMLCAVLYSNLIIGLILAQSNSISIWMKVNLW